MSIELPDFSSCRVMVVGDVMLDRYWQGAVSRISPEAPVPVVGVDEKDCYECPGGAANVALNLKALGCSVRLLGRVGEDQAERTLTEKLEAYGVVCHWHTVRGMPTTTKLRIIGHHQQMLRVDFEKSHLLEPLDALLAVYQHYLSQTDLVILSDYKKGVLDHANLWIQAAQHTGVPVFVDPKRNSFAHYRGATFITPNWTEFERVVGGCQDDSVLVKKGLDQIKAHQLDGLLVTRGAKGMTILQKGGRAKHLPAEAHEIYDVTGAGDTVIAVFSVASVCGFSAVEAARLANLAAGMVIGHLGAVSVSAEALRQALSSEKIRQPGVLTQAQAASVAAQARHRGEVVVMTNGCFDLLHCGHMGYLSDARALGDRLMVAVNDDESVSRLKGEKRPIHVLKDRMSLLAGLRSVDWVIPFKEDTPLNIIQAIKPDILVKGGDYTIEQVVGADWVQKRGGQVHIIPLLEGYGSSKTVDKILKAYAR